LGKGKIKNHLYKQKNCLLGITIAVLTTFNNITVIQPTSRVVPTSNNKNERPKKENPTTVQGTPLATHKHQCTSNSKFIFSPRLAFPKK